MGSVSGIKKDLLENVKECGLEDMKELFAEIAERYVDLASEFDVLDSDFTKLRMNCFLDSMAIFALVEMMKEKKVIDKEELKAKMLEYPGKERKEAFLRFQDKGLN